MAIEEQIRTMPVVALKGLTILPGMMTHFDAVKRQDIAAVEYALVGDQKVFLVTQRNPEPEEPELEDLYQVGTIALVKQLVRLPGKVVRVLVEGLERGELLTLEGGDRSLRGQVAPMDPGEEPDAVTQEAMCRIVKEKLEDYGRENLKFAKEILPGLRAITGLRELLNQTAIQMPWDYTIRQEILESVPLELRYEVVLKTILSEIEIYRIKREFQEKVKADIDQNQKEYILREQMKVIRQELGEENTVSEAEEYQKKVSQLKADRETKDKLMKEIGRFKMMPPGSQEANVLRTYIETLLELPWKKVSKDNDDLKHAQEVLDADHYGLDQVKERILEYLAVRTLTKKGTSPIVCLVGPPGTGKTSIARSVARALNKKYVRISLGGIRDEAEIRGHRKTYVGAMPGRIVEGLRQAGVSNPLMLLDEIDKVSSDYKGDTASALLEVLDSEQNNKFTDHYVEIPVDLSEVLFIATANDVQTIPRPLLDRMELIEITSYTENEKQHIGREHLIPKQMKNNGIKESQLTITDEALEEIISGYTKEAGVRSLERQIGRICRRTARKLLEEKQDHVEVTKDNLEEFLDRRRFDYVKKNDKPEVGIVRGLAWTSVGGDTLQIEVNVMPGTGDFMLTGQLGDVMKESAQAGISYIRSIAGEYQIEENFFEKHDIHIHIPEGAVPKDGPSAGITMATAMISAILNVPVRADLAMTGEITLRGRVLPIGGLKEKLLAAKKAGITTVLVPEKNRLDVDEMDHEITDGLTICFVNNMKEVLDRALLKEEK